MDDKCAIIFYWGVYVMMLCFGVYMVAFNDLDVDETIFISQTLKDLLVCASGIEKILYT